ncbi:MAG: hypothetical protein ACXAC5_01765 [Promethearchaeota archaeon]|jgi:hypothetical protein
MIIELTKDEQLAQLTRNQATTLDEYLETGRSEVTWKKCPIIRDANNNVLVISKNLVFDFATFVRRTKQEQGKAKQEQGKGKSKKPQWYLDADSLETISHCIQDESCSGVLVPSLVTGQELTLIINGDDSGDLAPKPKSVELASSISFDCLARLLSPPGKRTINRDIAAQRVARRAVRVLDVTADKRVKATVTVKKQLAELRKNKSWSQAQIEVKPPESGMTLMGTWVKPEWHQSATVLLTDGTITLLIGQDEGTYFGCQLADDPKTIKAAYESLTPPEAQRKAGVHRQGEWFVVPVIATSVPAAKDCLAICEHDDTITLPKEMPDSNSHYIFCNRGGEVRISADGVFACQVSLRHDEHRTITLPQGKWHTFIKSTAVRSVSQEGVD